MMFAHLLLVIVGSFVAVVAACRLWLTKPKSRRSAKKAKAKEKPRKTGNVTKTEEQQRTQEPKSNQTEPNRTEANRTEPSEIPFACFIGIAFLLTEHQMGFVGQGATGRTYVVLAVVVAQQFNGVLSTPTQPHSHTYTPTHTHRDSTETRTVYVATSNNIAHRASV